MALLAIHGHNPVLMEMELRVTNGGRMDFKVMAPMVIRGYNPDSTEMEQLVIYGQRTGLTETVRLEMEHQAKEQSEQAPMEMELTLVLRI
ncbi:hypothetical protein [Lentibacillus juripiscarius]|uniref:Uncharacterized protein n=1 Tax=Lentibacillus juripiscarius TaxID=257446 RepID=A0ABW5V3U2_9BACI